MSLPNNRRRKIRLAHSGEIVREDVLPEYGPRVSGLAVALSVSRQTVNELLRERRAIYPDLKTRVIRFRPTICRNGME